MKYKLLPVLISAALMVVVPAMAQAQTLKLGFVNFIEAMRNHPELPEKRKKFEEMFGKREQELKKILDKIKDGEKDFEKNKLVMTEADREKQLGEMRRMKQRYRLERDDLDKEQKIFNNEATIELEKSLYRAVADLAKKEKYDAILDSRFIMFGSDQMDVTQKVISALKK